MALVRGCRALGPSIDAPIKFINYLECKSDRNFDKMAITLCLEIDVPLLTIPAPQLLGPWKYRLQWLGHDGWLQQEDAGWDTDGCSRRMQGPSIFVKLVCKPPKTNYKSFVDPEIAQSSTFSR
jgi:hypothetical protein